MTPSIALIECPECMGAGHDEDRHCPTCHGAGEVSKDAADNYLRELRAEPCESCGEVSTDLEAVDDSDPEVGYFHTAVICGDCRRAPKQREAEMYGGLHPNALVLLGVDESWLYEDMPVQRKPMQVATVPVPATAGEFAEDSWLGGGL